MFYVLLLKPCQGTNADNAQPLFMKVEGEKHYEVKKILDGRTHYGKLQYLVKWMGYPQTDNQWLRLENVAGFENLIKLFHKLYPDKSAAARSKRKAIL